MKHIFFIIVNVLITLGTLGMLIMGFSIPFFIWFAITLLAWIFLGVSVSFNTEQETGAEEDLAEEEHGKIPGYEKSGLDIKGCYNCSYSKDVGNNTFVECKQYQQKVYRHNICDGYSV